VNISWVAGYCKQTLHGEEGESQTMTQPLWKTSDVEFNGPVPANPQNFEVHFYRDDHIELAMTEKDSPARLDLPATADRYTRPGIAVNDPPCAPDYDRAQARRRATRATGQGVTKP
jgi:hypothetical protein